TGRTGKLVLEQGLQRGHDVTAVARAPTLLQPREHLHIVAGHPLSSEELVPDLASHDVVISCLGQRSRQDANLLRDAAKATLKAMARAGVRRYLVISQGLLFPSRNPAIALFRLVLARHVADSTAMERLVQASDTEWTIVRPPKLVERDSRGGYQVKVDSLPDGGWTMPYVDLAAFLIDEAEKRAYPRAVVGLAAA